MANETKITVGSQIVFANHLADFTTPDSNSDLTLAGYTDAEIDLTSLANAAGRESAKVDLGPTRAEAYDVSAAIEFAATPTSGSRVDFYWAPSHNSTAASGNPHAMDGVDAAAPSGYGTLAELLKNIDFIGSLITTDEIGPTYVQVGPVGTLYPTARYGMLVVVNNSGAALVANASEHHIALTEILPQYQTT